MEAGIQIDNLSPPVDVFCHVHPPKNNMARRVMTNGPTDEDRAGLMNDLLVAVANDHDRAAFQAIFHHFAPRLKGFVMRQGASGQLADEVIQETMVRVWRKAEQFDPARASASTWIFTIARNIRIDLIRKANRPEPDMNDPAFVPDPEPLPHDRLSREQEAGRLRDIVADLPAEQQEVLRLAFFEEKPHPEVAAELGIPLGTVKSRIRLAMKRIRNEFGDRS